MVRIDTRMGLVLLALVALTPPAAAEEQGSDWLGAVGDFVRAGLGPARTIDDIRREEERSREAASHAAPAKPEAAPASRLAQPVPAAPAHVPALTPEPEAFPVMAVPAPAPAPNPARAAAAPAPASRPLPMPEARPAKPAAAPVPPPEARPAKPVVPVAARVPTPPPPPEPLSSRIAATATVDQAIKLGGSSDTYGQRMTKPAKSN